MPAQRNTAAGRKKLPTVQTLSGKRGQAQVRWA